MKNKLILCLALVLSGGLFGCSSNQTLHNKTITKTSLEKNGVTVKVSLPDAVSAGEPVEMVVNVTNAAPQSVFFVTWIRALGIHLVDSNKATPEMTPRGKSGPDSVIDYGINYATPSMTELKPGEHYEWRVDLGTLFILEPGKYLVSLKLKLSQSVPGGAVPFEISTEPLGFTEKKIQASQINP
jgi:ABC-type Fe3+-hydroxamate transport system substrate-binding protein